MTDPIYFPYYAADIKKSKPLGVLTLNQFYRSISAPKTLDPRHLFPYLESGN
jgi:hypothetical protein